MIKKYILFILLIVAFGTINAQTTSGVVKVRKAGGEVEPLAYASVYWLEGKVSAETNERGEFTLNTKGSAEISIVAAFVGHTKDTVRASSGSRNIELILREDAELEAARLVERQEGNYLSKMTPVKTEVITAAGLCKMACCNLAESFENSASVTVGYSDAITGARQIRLLGLSGTYTQMLDENRPAMRGVAAPFGLSYVPGQWLESIQIAKGPSSVVNGLEAITGQINLEHRKPTAEQPLFLNLFLGSTLRTEANIASSLQLNPKWSTVILGHFSTDPMGHDGNHDGFKDEPVSMQFNLSNRWLYVADNGAQVRFGFRALSDDRVAGMNEYKKGMEITNTLWGSEIKNMGLNGYLKVGIPLNEDNSKNIATVADYTWHRMNSFFGKNRFDAIQNSAFLNIMFQNQIDEYHKYVLGLSGQYDNFDEVLTAPFFGIWSADRNTGREESSAGAYGEYTYTNGEKVSVVAGLRLDRNNIHGWLFAPRLNVKYAFTDKLIFRASGGRGFRSPNQISDNLGILSTGRQIVLEEKPDIEDAWTYGANFTVYLPFGFNENSYLSFDYFRTDFNKQLLIDQERDISRIWLYNLEGRSFTNTYQADFSTEPFERFTVLATFRYTDSKATYHGQGLIERALTGRYKGVLNIQYATRMNKWTFDFTAQINGPSRLPHFMGGGLSPVYPMFFAQITKKFRDLDIYVGGENLGNYKQPHPIMGADNPYSPEFNSTLIWGPLMGRKVYAGLRFTLWK